MEWLDLTDNFTKEERYYKNLYLEKCEVALESIECSIFIPVADKSVLCEIFVNYNNKMYGVSYAPLERAREQREVMMRELEEEAEKNGLSVSVEFIESFSKKYELDVENAFFDSGEEDV